MLQPKGMSLKTFTEFEFEKWTKLNKARFKACMGNKIYTAAFDTFCVYQQLPKLQQCWILECKTS